MLKFWENLTEQTALKEWQCWQIQNFQENFSAISIPASQKSLAGKKHMVIKER